jgi:hypothetical protein
MTPEEVKALMKEALAEAFKERDEAQRAKRPLTYKIYKGMGGKQGCFQFSLSPAYAGKRKDEGAVFIEAAPTIGPNKYDWDNKIIFALSATDIGAVLTGFRQGKFDIYHDPDAQTDRRGTRGKRLSLQSGEMAGTFFLRLSEKAGEETKQTNISLQPHEARIILNLLEEALPKVLGWK